MGRQARLQDVDGIARQPHRHKGIQALNPGAAPGMARPLPQTVHCKVIVCVQPENDAVTVPTSLPPIVFRALTDTPRLNP